MLHGRSRSFRGWMPLGGVERPRRMVSFAPLIHRRVRAFWPALDRRRLRWQSQPALVATWRDVGTERVLERNWLAPAAGHTAPAVVGLLDGKMQSRESVPDYHYAAGFG